MVLFHCFEQAAIQYLFPSGIYDKKARPFMKPPEQVYPPRKRIQFDKTGRPFHYMFFTGFPHYYNLCHVCYRNILNRLHAFVMFQLFIMLTGNSRTHEKSGQN